MFTVRQLSRVAGVTPRTLHHYNAIGLLKPSKIGENGYRYYDERALLRLQQILFYRELDMSLDDIKRIMGRRDFDVLEALEDHRLALTQKARQLERLIETVDDTIQHLKGKEPMDPKELFKGFTDEEQEQYEQEAMQMYDPKTVKTSAKRWKECSAAEKAKIGQEGEAVYRDLLKAVPKGPGSPDIQAIIERWRHHLEYFWIPNDDQLLGLTDLYNEDPRFRANFDEIDPKLAPFMREAVKIYVERRGRSK